MAYIGMSGDEILEKIRETHLRQTCGYAEIQCKLISNIQDVPIKN